VQQNSKNAEAANQKAHKHTYDITILRLDKKNYFVHIAQLDYSIMGGAHYVQTYTGRVCGP